MKIKKHCVYSITPSYESIFYTVIDENMESNGEQWYEDEKAEDADALINSFEEFAKHILGVDAFTPIYVD